MKSEISTVPNSDTAKRWYIFKGPKDIRWVAYELTRQQAEDPLPAFELRGPFLSLFASMIAASE